MAYRVHTVFKTLQGEGVNAGRAAVFIRFAGCNGWSGRPEDRGRGQLSCSAWCDTRFVGGNRYDAVALAQLCSKLWGADRAARFLVLTGGEPTLQADAHLVDVLKRWEFEVAIETNGTRPAPNNLDWITVSPKSGLPLVQTTGDELKVVWADDVDPAAYDALEFTHRVLQPLWSDNAAQREESLAACVAYCLKHPRWRLGLQTHKVVGLP